MMPLEGLALSALLGLAGFRIASLLVEESGPFGVFAHVRTAARAIPSGSKLLSCTWCVSIWTTAGMYGVWQVSHAAVFVVAAMSFALLVDKGVN